MRTPFPRITAVALWLSLTLAGCESPVGGDADSDEPAVQRPLEGSTQLFDGAVELRIAVVPFFSDAMGESGRPGRGVNFRSRNRVREEFGTNEIEDEPRGRGLNSALYAPATHRVRVSLANKSSARVQMDVYEVRSILGTFGVRPNRLTIEPGQTVELDPMRSSIEERFEMIQAFVQVRHAGRRETVEVTLTAPDSSDAPDKR